MCTSGAHFQKSLGAHLQNTTVGAHFGEKGAHLSETGAHLHEKVAHFRENSHIYKKKT